MGLASLLDLFLNRPPTPNMPFIESRDGRKYWTRWTPDYWHLKLFYRGNPVGYINMLWELPTTLRLADIHLDPKHRGRGLGTALLCEVIYLAEREGAREIVGVVSVADLADSPNLLKWYDRFGFRFNQALGMWLDLTMPERPWEAVCRQGANLHRLHGLLARVEDDEDEDEEEE